MDLKEKIIRSAYELFVEKGYDKTTVAEIIKLVGTSKGGFYHHFKSKDELLEAITMNYIQELLESYEQLCRSEGSIIDKLNNVLITINQYKIDQVAEWPKMRKIFSFSSNHVILRKLSDQFQYETTKLYKKLIEEGIKEGKFEVTYPEMLAGLWTREIMWIYRITTKLIYAKDTDMFKTFEDQLDFTENLVNTILGFEENRIRIKDYALAYVENSRKLLSLKDY